MDRCPAHPDQETMVPCLECGAYFCRICNPHTEAGQYCSRCYLAKLVELGENVNRGSSEVSGVTKEKKDAAAAVSGLASKVGSFVVGAAKEHYPLIERGVEKYEGKPRLRECWYKLVAVVLSGAAIWTLVACLTHQRRPWVSVVVALLVAAGTVWSLGTRFGVMVGLFAMALALLSLATGEVIVQVLFRYGVVKTLDLTAVSLLQLKSKGGIYSRFFYNTLVLRFLPSAVVAFLVGWWPISRRIGWRGFRVSGRG